MRLKVVRQLAVVLMAVVSLCLLLASSVRREAATSVAVSESETLGGEELQMNMYSMGESKRKGPSNVKAPQPPSLLQQSAPAAGSANEGQRPPGGAPTGTGYDATLPLCPILPKELGLVGNVTVNQNEPTWEELEARLTGVAPGGRWKPPGCIARSRVAIVIPYMNRDSNLRVFLQHMHPFLQKQKLEYGIFVAEPTWENRTLEFNRGLLRNIGFMEAMKGNGFDCVVFHDVDLLPENDYNTYGCPDMPRHMCVSLDYYNYKPIASGAIFGGIVSFRRDHFEKTNGYSNLFFGWGGEDDDLYGRCKRSGIGFYRPKPSIGKYRGTPHTKDHHIFAKNYRLWGFGKERWEHDGLSTLEYSVTRREDRKLYTWCLVDYVEATYEKMINRYLDEAAVIVAERKRNATLAAHNGTMPVRQRPKKKGKKAKPLNAKVKAPAS